MKSIWDLISSVYTSAYTWHQGIADSLEAAMPILYTYLSPALIVLAIIVGGMVRKHAKERGWSESKTFDRVGATVAIIVGIAGLHGLALFLGWFILGLAVGAILPLTLTIITIAILVKSGEFLYNLGSLGLSKVKVKETKNNFPTAKAVHGAKR